MSIILVFIVLFSSHIYIFNIQKIFFPLRNVLYKINISLMLQFELPRSKINALKLMFMVLILSIKELTLSIIDVFLDFFVIVIICSCFCLGLI